MSSSQPILTEFLDNDYVVITDQQSEASEKNQLQQAEDEDEQDVQKKSPEVVANSQQETAIQYDQDYSATEGEQQNTTDWEEKTKAEPKESMNEEYHHQTSATEEDHQQCTGSETQPQSAVILEAVVNVTEEQQQLLQPTPTVCEYSAETTEVGYRQQHEQSVRILQSETQSPTAEENKKVVGHLWDQLYKRSIAELRAEIQRHNLSTDGLLEKADLVDCLVDFIGISDVTTTSQA